ncbi:Dagno [Scorpion polyomavirus 2]|nr:Dagno [Scorpion polyomavirus 2]
MSNRKEALRRGSRKWKLIKKSTETFLTLLQKLHNPIQSPDLSPPVKFQMGLLLMKAMTYAEKITKRTTSTDYSPLIRSILHTVYTRICSSNPIALKHLLTTYGAMQNWNELPKNWLMHTKVKKNLNKFYHEVEKKKKIVIS